MGVRKAAVAGSFYPAGGKELREMVDGFMDGASSELPEGRLRGLVVPHAGYAYSGPVAGAGYRLIRETKGLERAVIIGPSHYALFSGACEAGADEWETPLGRVKARSGAGGIVSVLPQAHAREHCIEVQLPFLQRAMGNPEIWPLLCGDVDASGLADEVGRRLDDSAIAIASSDLSHYLPYEAAVKRDAIANECVPSLDIPRFAEDGDACGKIPILALMHIAREKGWKGRFIDYRNSGDTAGGKEEVVGYGCYAFYSE
jgi:AmmeMemoRadiSam system protein B